MISSDGRNSLLNHQCSGGALIEGTALPRRFKAIAGELDNNSNGVIRLFGAARTSSRGQPAFRRRRTWLNGAHRWCLPCSRLTLRQGWRNPTETRRPGRGRRRKRNVIHPLRLLARRKRTDAHSHDHPAGPGCVPATQSAAVTGLRRVQARSPAACPGPARARPFTALRRMIDMVVQCLARVVVLFVQHRRCDPVGREILIAPVCW